MDKLSEGTVAVPSAVVVVVVVAAAAAAASAADVAADVAAAAAVVVVVAAAAAVAAAVAVAQFGGSGHSAAHVPLTCSWPGCCSLSAHMSRCLRSPFLANPSCSPAPPSHSHPC